MYELLYNKKEKKSRSTSPYYEKLLYSRTGLLASTPRYKKTDANDSGNFYLQTMTQNRIHIFSDRWKKEALKYEGLLRQQTKLKEKK